MTEFDDRARRAGERVRQRGSELGVTQPTDLAGATGEAGRRRLWQTAATAAAVVALAVGGWWVITDDDRGVMTADESSPIVTGPEPPATSLGTSSVTTPETRMPTIGQPSTTSPGTSSTSTAVPVVEPEVLLRPFVYPQACEALAAREWTLDLDVLHLFGRRSSSPFSIQVIGDPELGVGGPFALALRSADRTRPDEVEPVRIGDRDVAVVVRDNGNGAARWDLDDGGEGYVRSRGLDREQLIAIVMALTAPADNRDGDATDGFDVDQPLPAGFELLETGTNTDLSLRLGTLDCRNPDERHIFRIGALSGDPVFEYAAVIDRHVPLAVGRRDGAVIVIDGPDSAERPPTVADVVTADPDTWADLLDQPERWNVNPPAPPSLTEIAAAECAADPVDPHLLPDDDWVGEPDVSDTDSGSLARWGDRPAARVTQVLPAEPSGESSPSEVIEQARSEGDLISVGTHDDPTVVLEAAVIPIGDAPTGRFNAYLVTPDGCVRHYVIDSDLTVDDARTYVEVWLIVWGRGEP